MTVEQAGAPQAACDRRLRADAFKEDLTQAEAARRIATLSAKLKLLDEPPHTL